MDKRTKYTAAFLVASALWLLQWGGLERSLAYQGDYRLLDSTGALITGGNPLPVTGAVASSIVVGNPVTGGGANRVLFEDASQLLEDDAEFQWDDVSHQMSLGSSFSHPTDSLETIRGVDDGSTYDLAIYDNNFPALLISDVGVTKALTLGIDEASGATSLTGTSGTASFEFGTTANSFGEWKTDTANRELIPLTDNGQNIGAAASRIKNLYVGTTITMSGRILGGESTTGVTAASTITLGADGNYFVVTGNTTINCITNTGWQNGSRITLHFTGTPTIQNNQSATCTGAATKILLSGNANVTLAGASIMQFIFGGDGGVTAWRQEAPLVVVN